MQTDRTTNRVATPAIPAMPAAPSPPPPSSSPSSVDGFFPNLPNARHKVSCDTNQIKWTVARSDFHIGGRAAWADDQPRENYYDRFPLAARANVTSGGGGRGIWGLSKCTPGEFVGFRIEVRFCCFEEAQPFSLS